MLVQIPFVWTRDKSRLTEKVDNENRGCIVRRLDDVLEAGILVLRS